MGGTFLREQSIMGRGIKLLLLGAVLCGIAEAFNENAYLVDCGDKLGVSWKGPNKQVDSKGKCTASIENFKVNFRRSRDPTRSKRKCKEAVETKIGQWVAMAAGETADEYEKCKKSNSKDSKNHFHTRKLLMDGDDDRDGSDSGGGSYGGYGGTDKSDKGKKSSSSSGLQHTSVGDE